MDFIRTLYVRSVIIDPVRMPRRSDGAYPAKLCWDAGFYQFGESFFDGFPYKQVEVRFKNGFSRGIATCQNQFVVGVKMIEQYPHGRKVHNIAKAFFAFA